jgi:hypothetical protein
MVEIISISSVDNCFIERISDKRKMTTDPRRSLTKIDDYETSNFEEWVEESNQQKFKEGDKVVFVDCYGSDSANLGMSANLGWARRKLKKGNEYTIKKVSHEKGLELTDDSTSWNYIFNPLQFTKKENDFETSDFEEWVEESKREFKIGDKVKLVGLNPSHDWNNTYATIVKNDGEILGLEREKDKAYGTIGRNSDYLILVDEPKETDYEEWVEESINLNKNDLDRMIGRRLISTTSNSNSKFLKPATGTIIGYVSIYHNSDDIFYLVEFDSEYIIQNETNVYNCSPNIFRDYKEVNLPYNTPHNNSDWVDGRSDYFEFIDEPEETNFEEWVEETKTYKFKKGDRVKVIRCDDGNKLIGETGTITHKEGSDLFVIEFDKKVKISSNSTGENGWFGYDYEIELIDDEPEDTNYEEWIEETIK